MSGESGRVGVLLHGSGHRPEHWGPLQEHLRQLGRTTIAPNLPSTKPGVTYSDLGAAAAAALRPMVEEGKKFDVVAHSGAGHFLPSLRQLLGDEAISSIAYLTASLGASSESSNGEVRDPIDILRVTLPRQRNTKQFQDSISDPDTNGLVSFDDTMAGELFFNDCTKKDAEWAISLMRAHVRPDDEPPLEAHILPEGIKGWYLMPRKDKIRHKPWAIRAAARIGAEFVDIEGDHSPAISRAGQLAVVLTTLWDSVPNEVAVVDDEPVTAELQLPPNFGRPQPM